MAEIILEPTVQSKVIPLSIRLNDTDTSLVSQLVTNRQFSTADTDAWFSFTLEGLAATTGTFDLTLINLHDKSVFNHTDKVFNTNPFYYKLDSGTDELTNEIRHAGKWVGQLVVTLANGDSATRKFIFGIEGHILDGTVVQTILLEDYNALIASIESAKDELTQYNIDYASLIGTVTDQEAARSEAEELRVIADALRETKEGIRQATFEANEVIRDGVVDSAIEGEMIAQTVAAKLTEKEATFAPRILSVERELAENNAKLNLDGWELQNKTRKVRPMISFVSDDGNKKDYENLKPIADAKGVPFVSAVVSSMIGQSTQMTTAQLLEVQANGWEISSHTHTHQTLTGLTEAQMNAQFADSLSTFESLGIKCSTLCIPYGMYNDLALEVARKYFRCARSSDTGVNKPPVETFKLRSYLFAEDVYLDTASGFMRNSLEYYKLLVDKAVAENGWLIFLMHSNYVDSTQLTHLSGLIDYIQSLNIEVVTLDTGYNEMGNIVDVGNYTSTDLTKKHYVVGADGTTSTTLDNSMIFKAAINTYLNVSIPSAFPLGHIVINKVQTGSATGFPRNLGGTLTTDRLNTEDGWTTQTYRPYAVNELYIRVAVGDTWGAWALVNKTFLKVLAQDSVSNTTALGTFEAGVISYCQIFTGTAGFPETAQGLLITDNVSGTSGSALQTYKVRLTGRTYTRGNNGTDWTAWELSTNINTYLAQDAVTSTTAKTAYPQGKISYCVIGGANSSGFPVGSAGMLITNLLKTDNGFVYQEYHPYNLTSVYKRVWTSANVWGAWVRTSV